MLLLFLVSQLCLYLGNSQVSVYRTIGPLVYFLYEILFSPMWRKIKYTYFITPLREVHEYTNDLSQFILIHVLFKLEDYSVMKIFQYV